ncbi:hypothetical protein FACS1894219_12440 [Clostridia bacterium]|nr:hypothetical protein FACS1894219_12440 [Clostridia bacterium]
MAQYEKLKKNRSYLFLDTSGAGETAVWSRIGKVTEWTDSMNAVRSTYEYIEDSAPTDELETYKPTTSVPLTAYVGDPVYEFVFGLYRSQGTGSAAVTKALRVFQNKAGSGENAPFTAQLTNVLVTVDSFAFATGIVTFTLSQRGSPVIGTATVAESADSDGNRVWTPVFTEEA